MQPKVSQEILSRLRVVTAYPSNSDPAISYKVAIETDDGDTRTFGFGTREEAETFFKTLEVREPAPTVIGTVNSSDYPRLYTTEEVKEIVDAAVHPMVAAEVPVAGDGIWAKVKARWKSISVALSILSVLLSGYVTFKVGFGPVKVPDIHVTLPESQKPDKDVEARIPE